MKTLKRTSILIVISMFVFLSAFNPVISGSFVYADSPDTWTQVTTTDELVDAFKYYCKSRNLVIEGSALDAITSVTTSAFTNICNASGINMTALQAHIKWAVDGNSGLKYYFDSTGISLYNRIFSEFLQNNNLEVGDSANENDNKLYNGYSYQNTLFFVLKNGLSASYSGTALTTDSTLILQKGSYFQYTTDQIMQIWSSGGRRLEFFNGNNVITMAKVSGNGWSYVGTNGVGNKGNLFTQTANSNYGVQNGYPALFVYKASNNNTVIRLGIYTTNDLGQYSIYLVDTLSLNNNDYSPVIVYLTTNNLTINNNNYEGDTIINNDGTPSEPETEPEPPKPDPDDKWDIELPDLDVNWILSGKENKFPFNIPFNIMFALSLLNAEPEAPHFQGTINLGLVQWNYDIDLSPYNSVAVLCRNLEFLLFIIGLMFATKQLIWG